MIRSGYTYDPDDMDDDLAMGQWRAQVRSATRGKRGQKMLGDLLSALDTMQEKALIIRELQDADGGVCALGALARFRGIDMSQLDEEKPEQVSDAFNIALLLAKEIVFMNDEHFEFRYVENKRVYITPEERWGMMRKWVARQIVTTA